MIRYFLLVALLASTGIDDGRKDGRRGNKQYEGGNHEAAASAYRTGLQTHMEAAEPGAIHAGLLNNLGSALYESASHQEAKNIFDAAISMAPDMPSVARASYNAGNNVYRAGSAEQQGGMPPGAPQMQGGMPAQGGGGGEHLQAALDYYKQSLLSDPTNEDAKYNYEFVKRQLQEQQQQQQDQENQDENSEQQDQEGDQNSEENQGGDQQNEDQNQQDQNEQEGENQQQQQDQQQQQQQQEQQMDPNQLSRAEAERILQAFQNEEEELLREILKPQTRGKKVDRDW